MYPLQIRWNYGVIIFLYVDELLVFGVSLKGISDTKRHLTSQLKIKDLNEADKILRIIVWRDSGGIVFRHSLDKFEYLEFKEGRIPYDC